MRNQFAPVKMNKMLMGKPIVPTAEPSDQHVGIPLRTIHQLFTR
jgi:hypothetical protein